MYITIFIVTVKNVTENIINGLVFYTFFILLIYTFVFQIFSFQLTFQFNSFFFLAEEDNFYENPQILIFIKESFDTCLGTLFYGTWLEI